MSPSLTISITFSIAGIAPVLFFIWFFKSAKPKYHGLWIVGLCLIIIGALVIGIGTDLLQKTEDWLPQQTSITSIAKGKEAIINLQIWAYVFPAATISLGVNLITEFMLRRNDDQIK